MQHQMYGTRIEASLTKFTKPKDAKAEHLPAVFSSMSHFAHFSLFGMFFWCMFLDFPAGACRYCSMTTQRTIREHFFLKALGLLWLFPLTVFNPLYFCTCFYFITWLDFFFFCMFCLYPSSLSNTVTDCVH